MVRGSVVSNYKNDKNLAFTNAPFTSAPYTHVQNYDNGRNSLSPLCYLVTPALPGLSIQL